jgi:hypothetical protein
MEGSSAENDVCKDAVCSAGIAVSMEKLFYSEDILGDEGATGVGEPGCHCHSDCMEDICC